MAQNNDIVQSQIAKVQTNNKLIALYEKLKPASVIRYAQLHAKGEYRENGRKATSLIGIILQDYSTGTGQNNVVVSYNLAPEQIQFLLTRVTAGFAEYEWSNEKIFGEPDQNGLSIVQKFMISRHQFDGKGIPLRSPWSITIENGKGIKAANGNGGFYIKGGSYFKEKSVFIRLTDMDMYTLLKRTDSYITVWEQAMAAQLIEAGHKQMMDQQVAKIQQNQSQAYPQPNQYQNYQTQYGQEYGQYNQTQYSSYQNAEPSDSLYQQSVSSAQSEPYSGYYG